MENQSVPPKKIIINYGLILGIISVFLSVIAYVTNTHLQPHWSVMLIGMAVFIAVLVYGIKAFKKQNGGFLSIGQALKVGIGIALIAALIGAVWMLLLTNVLEPDYMEQVAEVQREQMVEKFPDMSEAQLNQAMEMNAKFSSPWITIASSIVVNLFIGFLVALIVGAIMKQKRPYED